MKVQVQDVKAALEKLTPKERKLVDTVAMLAQGLIELRQWASNEMNGVVIIAAQNARTGEVIDPVEVAHNVLMEVVGIEAPEGWQQWPANQSTTAN